MYRHSLRRLARWCGALSTLCFCMLVAGVCGDCPDNILTHFVTAGFPVSCDWKRKKKEGRLEKQLISMLNALSSGLGEDSLKTQVPTGKITRKKLGHNIDSGKLFILTFQRVPPLESEEGAFCHHCHLSISPQHSVRPTSQPANQLNTTIFSRLSEEGEVISTTCFHQCLPFWRYG